MVFLVSSFRRKHDYATQTRALGIRLALYTVLSVIYRAGHCNYFRNIWVWSLYLLRTSLRWFDNTDLQHADARVHLLTKENRFGLTDVRTLAKLQALVYDILTRLPSTTAVFSYAIGSRKLSVFCWGSNSSRFDTNNSNYIRRLFYNWSCCLRQLK